MLLASIKGKKDNVIINIQFTAHNNVKISIFVFCIMYNLFMYYTEVIKSYFVITVVLKDLLSTISKDRSHTSNCIHVHLCTDFSYYLHISKFQSLQIFILFNQQLFTEHNIGNKFNNLFKIYVHTVK